MVSEGRRGGTVDGYGDRVGKATEGVRDGLVKVAMSGDVGSGEGDEECRSGLGSTERVEGCA